MEKFILDLEKALISDYYDKRFFFNILIMIKDYFEADACSYNLSKTGEGIIITKQYNENKITIIDNLHIYNPKKEITNLK